MEKVKNVAITEQDKNADIQPRQTPSPKSPVDINNISGSGPHNINWLNSSYSGADIKVVAHLYEDTYSNEISDIQHDFNVAKKASDGATSVQTAAIADAEALRNSRVPSFEKVFIDMCFPGAQDANDRDTQDALGILFAALYSQFLRLVRSSSDLQATGNWILACQLCAQTQDALAKDLQEKLKTLKTKKDNSSSTLVLGHLQTISVQSHREKFAVRALGKSYAQGYTRGPRTLGGSMIFTVFDEHPLIKLIRAMGHARLFGETGYDVGLSTLMPDQLPPVDLTIVFANEYGSISKMGIYGVEFMNDGMTMSIEDLFTEQVMNFTARDVDVMTSVGLMRLSQGDKAVFDKEGNQLSLTATSLYYSGLDAYKEHLDALGLRRMFKGR